MDKPHNMFISWSGERSGTAAEFLREWLPKVIQAAKPWLSSKDIEKGSRSQDEIAKALQGIKFGIICLTPENLKAPWILYEAGALSKTLDDRTRLWTYLLGGLQPRDVTAPLGSFQATVADKEDTRKLLHTINIAVSDEAVREEDLNDVFDAMWPKLQEALNKLPCPDQTVPAKRTTEDMVAEILEITRAEANRRKKTEILDQYIPFFNIMLPQLYTALYPQFGMPTNLGLPLMVAPAPRVTMAPVPHALEPLPPPEPTTVPRPPDLSNLSAPTAPPRPAPVPTSKADPKAK